ncbi:MAG: energy transducer TonB [Deltaproteobacteria bacterium]|nr:energy transducer TonB [Deltaproteobacteria bacterium]
MGREIKGLIIGAFVSGSIHFALFFAPISPISAFPHVQEIPGSIEISLGAYQEAERERFSSKTLETKSPIQEVKASEPPLSPIEENDATQTKQPDLRGDSALAIPQQEGNPKPAYPEVARRKGHEGTVRLKVEVLASGKVGRIWITESSGYETLDRSALKTVKDWKFIPVQFAGVPVKSTVIVPVTFQLKD